MTYNLHKIKTIIFPKDLDSSSTIQLFSMIKQCTQLTNVDFTMTQLNSNQYTSNIKNEINDYCAKYFQ